MLKKEVRILGLSAPRQKKQNVPVIGAVFRGNLWLDGMLTCFLESKRRDHVSKLVGAITGSKQYSQLRAVILSREQLVLGKSIDIADLAHRIKLPIISIIEKRRPRATIKLHAQRDSKPSDVNLYRFKVYGKPVSVSAAGISCKRTQEIFTVSCTENHNIPEAVRVASLIAKQFARR